MNEPDSNQKKILGKLYKIRENLKSLYDKDNSIGNEYVKLNQFDLKVNDIWLLL